MMHLLYIHWTVDPILIELGPLAIRWYGLLFALGFMLGYYIIQDIIVKRESYSSEWMDSLLVYMMVGTVLGARLGHVFFYQWDYYQENLGEILQVWKGGLASHGATIGIILSLWIWSKRVSKKKLLWILDRIVIAIALAAVFIRTGNLINHEIVGKVTEANWGFKFLRNSSDLGLVQLERITKTRLFDDSGMLMTENVGSAYDKIISDPSLAYVWDNIPARFPAQMFEAGAYILLFGLLAFLYYKTNSSKKPGLLFGVFLIGLFSARFLIEFTKDVQVAFEESMSLNMGQLLSIPLIVIGVFFLIRSLKIDEAGSERTQ